MSEYLKVIGDRFISNKLTININKTSYKTFGCTSKKLFDTINISINSEAIAGAQTIKYLGAIFDCRC